ncbi:MAG TPA: ClpX C4-type zinc finger protein [Bryobacteraceae bacterium]
MRRTSSDSDLRCSFCNKSKDVVGSLISSPSSGRSQAYICAECVDVCVSIIKDRQYEAAADALTPPRELAFNPLIVPDLLETVERWTQRESAGLDASAELASMRHIAAVMFNTANRET